MIFLAVIEEKGLEKIEIYSQDDELQLIWCIKYPREYPNILSVWYEMWFLSWWRQFLIIIFGLFKIIRSTNLAIIVQSMINNILGNFMFNSIFQNTERDISFVSEQHL